ncbi:MAG: ABC transporter permease [Propionibacteriaceae bacterium]|nr:ABC transporter permease [Propionibacteriaceae bacterium]
MNYYPDHARPLWRRALVNREMAIVYLLVATVAFSCLTVDNFAQSITVYNILRNYFSALILALPMCLVMITGDIDISVGSMVGLSCSLLGLMYISGVPFELAMVVAIGVGALGGLLNGLLVTRVGLPSLAVTLGTMALFRGLAVGALGTTTVTKFPEFWTAIPKYAIGETGVPVVMVFFAVLMAAFIWLLHFTAFGRGVYAIGLNSQAAAFSGVDSARTRTVLFVLAGTLSGVGGVYWTLLRGVARGDTGSGLELQVIAAVVLGGVSVFGGVGAVYGCVAGVLLIGVLANALQVVGVTADIIKIITGGLLIASVMAGSLIAWTKNRRVGAKAASAQTE